MTTEEREKDHRHYMLQAENAALWSHDLNTKVGVAVKLVGGNAFFAKNDIPPKLRDLPERRQRPAKYIWTEHAERTAVYIAAHLGVKLQGSAMYICNGSPCHECARAIIMSGISTVVMREPEKSFSAGEAWAETCRVGMEMLQEAGVTMVFLDGDYKEVKVVRGI